MVVYLESVMCNLVLLMFSALDESTVLVTVEMSLSFLQSALLVVLLLQDVYLVQVSHKFFFNLESCLKYFYFFFSGTTVVVEIESRGVPRLGSSNYTVQCNAYQIPWNAQLVRYRWNNTADGQLMPSDRLNISLLNSTFDPDYATFIFNSSIQFNPLAFEDAGYISCGLALNLTYPDGPDNSSIILMNRTTTVITIDGK